MWLKTICCCTKNSSTGTYTLRNSFCNISSQIVPQSSIGVFFLRVLVLSLSYEHAKHVVALFSDRSGLNEPDSVEKIQDAILGAFKRYVSENRPHQPLHWAKILMKVTDLRTISTRHAERVLCIRLDNSGEIPPLLLEVFNEGHTTWP